VTRATGDGDVPREGLGQGPRDAHETESVDALYLGMTLGNVYGGCSG
jgi:hypothetical protein